MSEEQRCLYEENPRPEQPHVLNYIGYFADAMRRHRNSLDKEHRTTEAFGKSKLAKYYGKPIQRSRISRAESGYLGTHWGIIAAYLYEMGVFPELIAAIERGRERTLRYMTLVNNELAPEIRRAISQAEYQLSKRARIEKAQGIVTKP